MQTHFKTLLIPFVLLSFSPHILANGSCTNENTAIPFSTPSSDFILHNDGTATHNATGLMWMRCSMGQTWQGERCTGVASEFTWQEALTQNGTNYAGYSDWRLPNKNELASILELRCYNPSINDAIFPDTPASWFWSSSPAAYDSDFAWYVNFNDGDVNYFSNKDGGNHVRLVRARQ